MLIKNDLIKAKELLFSGEFTCVVCKGEKLYTSKHRGVKPLVAWYIDNTNLKGFSVADKVVGKATAFLYVLLGIKNVYAKVVSSSALQYLEESGIYVEYGTLVDYIINRRGDGICPFESAVLNINNEQEAYKEIRKKMDEMNIQI